MSRATVVIELVEGSPYSQDLAAGGVSVPRCTLSLGDECELLVCGAQGELRLPARVVYVDEQGGAGLELVANTPELKAQLAALAPLGQASPAGPEDDEDDDLAIPLAARELEPPPTTPAGIDDGGDAGAQDWEEGLGGALELPRDDAALDSAEDTAGEPRAASAGPRMPRNVHERLRGLTLNEQLKVAAQGELHERIVLERLYGKSVWETLLRNPRLTAPEVARIARYGSLPRVLLEVIVANATWLQVPEVRRALLANPRLATDQIVKVLRLMPKHELKLAAIQTVYPFAVRNAAKLLLRGQGD